MRTEYFKKNDLISLINSRLERLNHSTASFNKMEETLAYYEEILLELQKVRKFLPLTHRAQYALLSQYSQNILKSLKISFKKEDFIGVESLILEEIPSSILAWKDFVNTIKW